MARLSLSEKIRELRRQQGPTAEELAELQRKAGRRIRELRQKRGLSQEALADESGLHRTYVGSAERGERNLTLTSLKRLADALEVSLAELMKGL